MLTKDERILLENTIEALNRLFDRDSKTIDTCDLLFATGKALSDARARQVFGSALVELKKVI